MTAFRGMIFSGCLIYLWIAEVYCTASERFYMEDECGRFIDMETRELESIRVELTKYQVYTNSLDCVLRVKAPRNKRLEVKFTRLNIVRSTNCTRDFLRFHDGQELIDPVLPGMDPQICSSSSLQSSYSTTSVNMTLRFKSDETDASEGFHLVVTAFRTDPDGECYNTEFQCKSNKRCISERLVCDHFRDCTDASDECELSIAAIIGIAVGAVIGFMAIIGILVCACCLRKRRERNESTKHLNSSSNTVTLSNGDVSDLQYHRPKSYSQPVYAVPTYGADSPYSLDGPFYIYKPNTNNPRHIWITGPPEMRSVSPYD